MPEYLAPGVYIEEIPSANKPIAAASTSTSAMVGMTERGPVGRAVLVTSPGDYARKFGGKLNPLAFQGGLDMLPYAAEGFFGNGGSRLYVVRVVGDASDEARLALTASTGTPADNMVVQARAASGQALVLLSNADGIAANDTFLIQNGDDSAFVTAEGTLAPRHTIAAGLTEAHAAGDAVTLQTITAATTIAALNPDDGAVVTVAAIGALAAGDTVLIGAGDTAELAVIEAVDGDDITFEAPLANGHEVGAEVSTLAASATASTILAAAGPSGLPVHLELNDPGDYDAGDVISIDGELALISAVPQLVTLTENLEANQPAGVMVTPATPVATVHGVSDGIWGRQLRVRTEASHIVSTTTVGIAAGGTNQIVVVSAFGLYPGSVILVGDADSIAAGNAERFEVSAVNTNDGIVTLTRDLPAEVTADSIVQSQEFDLIVERVGDDGKVAESELFETLSLSSEHPRYALTVVGSWDTGADRPSDTGRSQLIRISDQADGTTRILPLTHGLTRHLQGGNDDVGGVSDASFIGTASSNPDERTGIEALRNVTSISLVSVPGRTNVNVHKALLNHCEAMRYRFAVLETPLGANFDAAQTYRQNFDNTRCALYYPGLTIADPFGADGSTRNVTPSGHMMGLYARIDNTRGVHKAPANEVVRGVLSFESKISKGEQDILNPKNLNCFRDFRDEFRGLRAYGARVATSDPEWRYINVRRLLLMIEQSLDTGLQWAVFEPNEKPLWDAVKQSVTGFLTTVWRSGALEGQSQEEAFFVNIGYGLTMTQDDIDNGRMIVEIGVAPVKPAEFVIARISQKTREATG